MKSVLTSFMLCITLSSPLGAQIIRSTWIPAPDVCKAISRNTATLTVPAGYLLLFETNQGSVATLKAAQSAGVKVECDCKNNEYSRCSSSIFVSGNSVEYRCDPQSSCEECSEPKVTYSIGSSDPQIVHTAEFIREAEGTRIIKTADLATLPPAFPAMLRTETLKKGIQTIVRTYRSAVKFPGVIPARDGVRAPKGWQFAAVSLYGRAAVMAIPSNAKVAVPGSVGLTVSCPACAGSGSCLQESITYEDGTLIICKNKCTVDCAMILK